MSRAVGLQLRATANLKRGLGLELGCSLATSGAPSKWSYQIVFPLDGSRFTVAALVLFVSLKQKESIARRNYTSTHAVISSDREVRVVFGEKEMPRLLLTVLRSALRSR